ncbi:MAG: GspE/PulE family protein [Bdellovibrionales bacterium]
MSLLARTRLPDAGDDTDDPLASALLRTGRLGEEQLDRAGAMADETHQRLGNVITQLGLLPERVLAEVYSDLTGAPPVRQGDYPQEPVLPECFSAKFLRSAHALPIGKLPGRLDVAMVDPLDTATIRAMGFSCGRKIVARPATLTEMEAALARLYPDASTAEAAKTENAPALADENDLARLKDMASGAPVIRLVDRIIAEAVAARASDIHVESTETGLRVRYRIDGILQDRETPPAGWRAAILSRIKLMARLNIAERRLAQDGRIRLAVRGHEIDLRVATTPTIHGESVTLRILDRAQVDLDFAKLGFDADILGPYLKALDNPTGIILVTGPTGSGKTTTLYASLQRLNAPERKIMTVEDPVEYLIEGINQVQVKPSIGLTFAAALRSFLRLNPDIMLVGEIRDLETADIAVQASLTGHRVLSTLHTNDAATGITRLLDMGVADYLMSSTLSAIVAQRLVRCLCPHCKAKVPVLPEVVAQFGLDRLAGGRPVDLWEARGCAECNLTGYRGRSMILEFLPVTDVIRQHIMRHSEARDILAAARAEGMRTMLEHGLTKALAGQTTVAEVLRVIGGA